VPVAWGKGLQHECSLQRYLASLFDRYLALQDVRLECAAFLFQSWKPMGHQLPTLAHVHERHSPQLLWWEIPAPLSCSDCFYVTYRSKLYAT